MLRRFVVTGVLLCGCRTDLIVDPNEGGGGSAGDGGSGAIGAGAGGEGGGVEGGRDPHGGSGEGGQGGEAPKDRTIVVDVSVPEGASADDVVILVSAPDGTVSDTLTGGDLPVEVGVNDGDLVTYAYGRIVGSYARSFRVTPAVTEVQTHVSVSREIAGCEVQPPMSLTVSMPEVEGANDCRMVFFGEGFEQSWPVQPGTATMEVHACDGADSFSALVVARPSFTESALAFARLDGIPYVPGSNSDIPIVFSSERLLIDLAVEGEPGLDFRARAVWRADFGMSSDYIESWTNAAVEDDGTSSLSFGPLAIGGEGSSWISVSDAEAGYFTCEVDLTWRNTPSDGSTMQVRFGALAKFEPTDDGNVALGPGGEIGDVVRRRMDEYTTNTPALWELNEDPLLSYPLPVEPEVPAALLPDFEWPSAAAELRYIHEDFVGVEGYADFARVDPQDHDGRALHRVPEGCF